MDINIQAIIDECMDLPNDLDGLEIVIRDLATFAYKKEPINQYDLDAMFFLIGIATAKVWSMKEENKQKL